MSARFVLLRNALRIYTAQGLTLAAALISSALIARTLGPAGKGTLDLFLLLTALLPELMSLGVSAGVLYQIANRRRPLNEVHGTTLLFSAFCAAIGVLLAGVGPAAIAALIGDVPPALVSVALALAGVLVYSAIWPSLMVGVDRATAAYVYQAVVSGLGLMLIVGLAITGTLTVTSAVAASTVTILVGAIAQYVILRHREVASPTPTARSMYDALAYGLRSYPGVVANWSHFRIDQIIVSRVVGTGGVGIYSVSVRWAEIIWRFGYAITSSGLFRIASGSRADSFRFSLRFSVAVLAVSSSSAVILAVLSRPLILTIYGSEFEGAVLPLLLLLPGIVAWDWARVLSQFISFTAGRPDLPAAIGILGGLINLVVTLAAVPALGIAGAALASSVSYIAVAIATAVLFWWIGRGAETHG